MSYILRQDCDRIHIDNLVTGETACWLDKEGVHPAEVVSATHTHNFSQLHVTASAPIARVENDVRLVNDAAAAITHIDTDEELTEDSDQRIPTQKAVKGYVDGSLALRPTLQFPTTLYSLDTQESGAVMVTPKNSSDGKMTTIDTDSSLTANSDLRLVTQKAVKAYVDAHMSTGPIQAIQAYPIGVIPNSAVQVTGTYNLAKNENTSAQYVIMHIPLHGFTTDTLPATFTFTPVAYFYFVTTSSNTIKLYMQSQFRGNISQSIGNDTKYVAPTTGYQKVTFSPVTVTLAGVHAGASLNEVTISLNLYRYADTYSLDAPLFFGAVAYNTY